MRLPNLLTIVIVVTAAAGSRVMLAEPGLPSPGALAIVTPAASGATAISNGELFSCVLTAAGGVQCWGYNGDHELGDGSTATRDTPRDVTGLTSGVVAVATGGYFACALTAGGGVKCWGDNYWGELGDGTTTERGAPVDVTGLTSGVTAIAAGLQQACALTNTGGVKCWGANDYGQLGDGSKTQRLTPVDVTGLTSGVAALARGAEAYHTCALTTSGGVKCWGHNDTGQLGDGSTTDRLTPVDVNGLTSGVSSVAVGYGHTCAVTSAGAVKCWGDNGSGQLGDSTYTQHLTPVQVSGLASGVASVTAGYAQSCAVKTSGGVACWGDNSYGELGDGTTTTRPSPVAVIGLAHAVSSVSTTSFHTCALTTDGRVQCWGTSEYGQLGGGGWSGVAGDVAGLTSGAASISPGMYHTCAVTTTGGVKCWGRNTDGQLGDGTQTTRTAPTSVAGLTTTIASVAAGAAHTCALTASGSVQCWGFNGDGELGDGTTISRSTPANVSGLTSGVIAIASGAYHTCALTNAGGLKCWGYNVGGELGDGTNTSRSTPVNVVGLTSGVAALALESSALHTCAVTNAGGLKCWGYNVSGQLGDGTTTLRYTPVDVVGLTSGVAAASVGQDQSCALTTAGSVQCWGKNAYGEVGDGTTTIRLTPVPVSGLANGVTAIGLGYRHSCAVLSNGQARCWGTNYEGGLGNGGNDSSVPANVIGVTNAVAIGAGYYDTCVLTSAGGVKCWGEDRYGALGTGRLLQSSTPTYVVGYGPTITASISSSAFNTCAVIGGGVKCWGQNDQGQLGDNTTATRTTPVDVTGLTSGVVSVSAGYAHTCALTSGGGVKCWGDNTYGQVGDGTVTERHTPVDVAGLTSGVVAITVGWNHSCAVLSTGGVKCWGDNSSGQLGDGTTTGRSTPVNVSGLGGVLSLAAGQAHTCAVNSSGGLKCWGYNSYGALGDGTQFGRLTPVDVSGLTSGVAAVAAGNQHTCALTSSGGAKCWGDNGSGQDGDGSTSPRFSPVDVVGLSTGVVAVTAGYAHSCAVLSGGGMKCWGFNYFGELGDGTTTTRTTPVDVSGVTGATAAAASYEHTCAVTAVSITCWGYNAYGELGDGTQGNGHILPADVVGLSTPVFTTQPVGLLATPGQAVTFTATASAYPVPTYQWQVSINGGSTFNNISNGGPYSGTATATLAVIAGTGTNTYQYRAVATNTAATSTSSAATLTLLASSPVLSGSGRSNCAVIGSGVKCWGSNDSGQIGDNTTTNRPVAIDVSGLTSGVVAVSVGAAHACALTTGGGLKCWGLNAAGQLGDNTTTNRLTPVDVSGLTSGVSALAAGFFHTCAVVGGGVKCWGGNDFGQLGDGTWTERHTPVDVSGLSGVVALGAGAYHTCALTSAGSVKCWGNNADGELGDGTTDWRQAPVDSGLSSDVAAVFGGYAQTCALTSHGGAKCWGGNYAGQVGDGTTDMQVSPVDVSGLTTGVLQLAPGYNSTCAVLSGGGTLCWGGNDFGQIGDGTLDLRVTPVAVSGLTGATTAAAGFGHACALLGAGGAKCWGYNGEGELGDGTSTDRLTAVDVIFGAAPLFVTQPSNQAVTSGQSATFTVAASGTPTPTYQWQVSTDGGSTFTDLSEGAPYTNVTSATLTVATAVGLNGYRYRSVATNGAGSATSNAATLTVNTAPAFTTQPSSATVTIGADATFFVTARGNPAPTYQWQISTNGGASFSNLTETSPYSGTTTTTLIVAGVAPSQSGTKYRCIATNNLGAATSSAATLTVATSFTQQGPKLVGSGYVNQSIQGVSVAVSADGNTAIVGGPRDNNDLGAAWVWVRSGGVWTQQGPKLVGSGVVAGLYNAYQGYAVALSADGNTAAVGGVRDNNLVGAVWIWTRNGGVWTQQGAKLVASDAVGTSILGASLALSADGNTLIVGGSGDSSSDLANVGAAWVFTRSGSTWTQQGSKLIGSGSIGQGYQGCSVSISADGNTAAVGGCLDNNGVGATWIWVRNGDIWTQQGSKLVGSGGVGKPNQGTSVSLSADGNTAIIGGYNDNSYAGATWVWTRSGAVWTQQGPKLVGSGGDALSSQGTSVSVSGDGNTAIVGGFFDNNGIGALWVWTRSGGVWTQQGAKLVGSGAVASANYGNAQQGYGVALSADGSTALVGGPGDANGVGAAWVFTTPVVAAPAILTHPGNATVTSGTNASFTAAASGNPAPTFQWQVSTNGGSTFTNLTEGAPYTNVTSTTLTVAATAGLSGYQFRCVATNVVASTNSNAATLTVNTAPAFTTQPSNATVTSGTNASFTVAASGSPAPTYQWQVSTNGGSTFTNLTNAPPYSNVTTTTLTVAATAPLNGYQYRCVATNVVASTNSNAATLTVNSASASNRLVHLNGDASSDAFVYNASTGYWYRENTSNSGGFTEGYGGWAPGWSVLPANFNGDALTDMFVFSTTNGQWYKLLNDGTGFVTQASGVWAPVWQRYVLDLDGDGIDDLFLYDPASGAWYKCLSTPTGFTYIAGAWTSGWEIYPVNLNGDALGDMFLFNRTTGQWYWAVGTAGGFTYPQSSYWANDWKLYPGDFNGDGQTDLLLHRPSTGENYVAMTTASGFTYTAGAWITGWTPYVADLDGDGKADLFLYNKTTGTWVELLSTGGGGFSQVGGGYWAPGWDLYPADFNGDGRIDWLLYNPTNGQYYQAWNTSNNSFTYYGGNWLSGLTIITGQPIR